jgi:hypothetical protein
VVKRLFPVLAFLALSLVAPSLLANVIKLKDGSWTLTSAARSRIKPVILPIESTVPRISLTAAMAAR